jgi:hypothetical protein
MLKHTFHAHSKINLLCDIRVTVPDPGDVGHEVTALVPGLIRDMLSLRFGSLVVTW